MLLMYPKLLRNLVSLFIWQGSTYLVPLIVTPYLARILGVHGYGLFGFAIAIISYCTLLTDWGFGLSATQKVAQAVDDPVELSRVFWYTLTARFLLGILAFAVLMGAIVAVPDLRVMWPTLLASSLAILATALTCNWFLQGMQSMGLFATSSLLGRLLVIPLMLLFVHDPEDVTIAVAIQAATQLISAAVSLYLAHRLARLAMPDNLLSGALRQIRDGSHQFMANVSVSLYNQLNAIAVGFSGGPVQAGLYLSSQRLSQAFQGLVIPINMAVYPAVNRAVLNDPPAAVRLMFRVIGAQIVFSATLSLAMYLSAPNLVVIFLGPAFESAIPVAQMLAFLPFLIGVTNVLGTNTLLPLGMKSAYLACLVSAGVLNITLLLLLVPTHGAVGGAMCAVLTEAFIVVAMSSVLIARRDVFRRMRQGQAPNA
jgi:O-antigen/teichoic acid export membrane protein